MYMLGFQTKAYSFIWWLLLGLVLLESLLPYGTPSLAQDYGDIALHFCCFFLLAFLPVYDVSHIRQGLFLALLMAIVGAAIEMAQLFLPGRDCSPLDIFTNNLGVVTGLLAAALCRGRKKIKEKEYGERS
ncbi:MAG: VanZ family protein [Desulfobacca sp.]|uniref:VanZ family protein n=1 Tax=Desulfobacca sp. TaxID=2067990 RepID=UPI00404930B0